MTTFWAHVTPHGVTPLPDAGGRRMHCRILVLLRCPTHCWKKHRAGLLMKGCPVAVCLGCPSTRSSFLPFSVSSEPPVFPMTCFLVGYATAMHNLGAFCGGRNKCMINTIRNSFVNCLDYNWQTLPKMCMGATVLIFNEFLNVLLWDALLPCKVWEPSVMDG